MITIIDYKTGNLSSIVNMIKKIGGRARVSSSVDEIRDAEKLILPGVGHFDYGMRNLRNLGLLDVLNEKALIQKVPVLGICLGVQLLSRRSEEGVEPGLGWIDAETKAFDRSRITNGLKVPHMGWSDVRYQPKSRLFTGFDEIPRFYFVHSFHLVCANPADELTYCSHGYEFVAGIERDNVMGVQFHPEKSHRFGMRLLDNFVKLY